MESPGESLKFLMAGSEVSGLGGLLGCRTFRVNLGKSQISWSPYLDPGPRDSDVMVHDQCWEFKKLPR